MGFSSLISDGYVGLIEWVSVGLGISGLIGNDGVGLVRFFGFLGLGLISNGGVGLIRFFWVFKVGFDRQ